MESALELISEGYKCKIDLEIYDNNERKPLVINCGHSICEKCFKLLTDKKCPFCRAQIVSKSVNYSLIESIETFQQIKNEKEIQKEKAKQMEMEKEKESEKMDYEEIPAELNQVKKQEFKPSVQTVSTSKFSKNLVKEDERKYDEIIKKNLVLIKKLNSSNSIFYAIALNDYTGENFDELSFKKNEKIKILSKVSKLFILNYS